jgi:hypothetical protein
MIRLARRTSLLVTISLFTSTMTAHAECAWMLWIRSPWIEGSWQIQGAQLSARECIKNLEALVLKYKLAGNTVFVDADERQAIWEKEEQFGSIYCFPDTIDPRGPEAK